MIIGIGTDILKISRIENIFNKYGDRFSTRILCRAELNIFENKNKSISFLAKRFSVKEAASKALGTGISNGINLNEIIVKNNNSGKPYFNFEGNTKKLLKKKFKNKEIKTSLSLSDENKYAVAFVTISL